jgi:hypothetical protein
MSRSLENYEEFKAELKEYEKKAKNARKKGQDATDELIKAEKDVETALAKYNISKTKTRSNLMNSSYELFRAYSELVPKLTNAIEIAVKYHSSLLDLYNIRYKYDKTNSKLSRINEVIREIEQYIRELESKRTSATELGKKASNEHDSWRTFIIEERRKEK